MKDIVKKGRIAQWIIMTGGTAIALVGGLQGFLNGDQVVQVVLAMITAAFGIEAAASRGGGE